LERFRILGSLSVTLEDSGETLALAPKVRIVLARLLLSANRIVPLTALIDALWDGPPPRTARVTTQGYVKDLRRVLGDRGKTRIVTIDPGYKLVVHDDELDLDVFARLRGEATAAARTCDWEAVAAKLHAALRLWRDDPLIDVPSVQLHRQEAPALTEAWLQVLEQRVDADLLLGRHLTLVPELRKLTSQHPLRERLHGQLMTALYLSGQQAEAMDAYQRVCLVLREELGVSPGRGLRDLHQRMLADGLVRPCHPSR
jgi:DNA-binding SARP family transcriptional activator